MDGVLWFLLGVLVGGVVGLLVGRWIGARGRVSIRYPPGLKPTAIGFNGSVVVFVVAVTREGNRVFSSGKITVTRKGNGQPWSQDLTDEHLESANTCNTVDKVKLWFDDASFSFMPGTQVTVLTDCVYDGRPLPQEKDDLWIT